MKTAALVGACVLTVGGGVAGASATVFLTQPVAPSGMFQGEVPVLLVPGWFDTGRTMAALRIRLVSAGWRPERVATLTFKEPSGGNRGHARELGDSIDALLARTGATRLDIVAHSMGGLATRAYLRERGGSKVRRVAFLATPQRGTLTAYLAFGRGRDDMLPDSPFLAWLNAGAPVPPGVEAMTVRTPLDTRILPNESATLSGVEDHIVCCPTHAGLVESLEVFRLVRRFLDDVPLEVSGA
jgi:triacylglycerol lipase